MCGIVGGVAQRDIAEILIEGLRRLEYRGYDSAGLSVTNQQAVNTRIRRVGKVQALADAVVDNEASGGTGVAHTRWATHGEPNENNAHPHVSNERITIVHNGIIENHQQLKQRLSEQGFEFVTDTDSEVICHLIHYYLKTTQLLLTAVQQAVKELEGAYGTVVMDNNDPGRLVVARSGSPLVIGYGIGEHFVASDQLALLPVTRRFSFLEEGDVAELTRSSVTIYDQQGHLVEREITESNVTHDVRDKGAFRHFMLKEIYEQPTAIQRTLDNRLDSGEVLDHAFGEAAERLLPSVEHVQIIACGTSYHAGMTARYWFEEFAGVSCNVEIASEYRYRKSVVRPNSLLVTISQSGETADTLAALRLAKKQNYMTSLTICNAPGSSLVRESDMAYMMEAGVEIGVASTKAFTVQLAGLMILAGAIGHHKGLTKTAEAELVQALQSLPTKIEQALAMDADIERLAEDFADKSHSLFLGRGDQYPIAMEGALKLKEISYIHAEAYAAGELKHGPLALIDADMPVIVVAPNNELVEKLKSNVEEVRARGGSMYVFADKAAAFDSDDAMKVLQVPSCHPLIAPIIYTIPLQLLSYHVAIIKGTDVDQPRNLAKSVTVE
ncbi:MAG: glutamine--fructose-6-phosphate transaminase (isomerizing) [Pseudomonadales bacterium]|nr:glutamine--fructose-6-phosphate transaminase (isomerizing) [Pseudomonadales bacterium]